MLTDTPVVVQAALNGVRERSDGAAIPVADDDVVADALAVWDAGAAVINLHAREPDGTPSVRAERYQPLVEGIRAGGCDAVLNLACGPCDGRASGVDVHDWVRLRPELVSFGCGMPGSGQATMDKPIEALRELAGAVTGAAAVPQIECTKDGHVLTALRLRDEGLLSDPLRFQLILGAEGAPATIEQALYLRSLVPPDAVWSVSAPGTAQLRLNMLCLIAGGHIRTGLADNVWLVEDVPATNRELVERVVRIVDDLDRPLATPDEARGILCLNEANAPRLDDEHGPHGDRRQPQAA
jgi:3-keto-5-aminohexanoate cleavage enzyme